MVTWHDGKVPTTQMRLHAPGEFLRVDTGDETNEDFQGWTVFENLYILNGTVFIVTDEPTSIPDRKLLTSSGYPLGNSVEEVAKRTPSDRDMQIISSAKAAELFGSYASLLEGTSVSAKRPRPPSVPNQHNIPSSF